MNIKFNLGCNCSQKDYSWFHKLFNILFLWLLVGTYLEKSVMDFT